MGLGGGGHNLTVTCLSAVMGSFKMRHTAFLNVLRMPK